jgi:hypothetical protein
VARAFAFALAALVTAGCNGNGSMMMGSPDMALPKRAATDHGTFWGGNNRTTFTVQAAPEVYTVVWAGDPYATQTEAFINWMLGSDYWTGALKEYGVGKGKSMGIITIPGAPPAKLTDAQLATLAQQQIDNGNVANPNSNTNLAFFIPQSTDVTLQGVHSCVDIGGFHEVASQNTQVTYSAIFECLDPTGTAGGGTVFDGMTKVGSHEIAEAATDPHQNGYYSSVGEEVADLCNFDDNLAYDFAGDATHPAARYWVQRMYSFATAKLGNADPCLPVPYTRPFFGVTTDPAMATVRGSVGATLNFNVEPFAYADVGVMHWQVTSSPFQPIPLEGTVNPGDTVALSLIVPKGTPSSFYEIDIGIEASKGGSFTWPLYITVQ